MADAVQYGWIKYLFKKQLWPKAVNMLTAVLYTAILKKQAGPTLAPRWPRPLALNQALLLPRVRQRRRLAVLQQAGVPKGK
ncbi:unnamed protein product [Brassica rapa]|uniref:Uncharacterized protein n=1 Tax=Brassica campestris TaxID=3711 RepID=A0A3P6BTP2_BRACM|nr:unnamed protein product [Brassica rapa]VDD02085.1 unnamed protein product [Brassica rapa]